MYSANANTTAKDIASDAKTTATRAKDEVRETVHDIRSDLESTARKAGRKVHQYFDTASDEVVHAADVVKTQIRTNPVQSSVIALAAGFVLGALFRR